MLNILVTHRLSLKQFGSSPKMLKKKKKKKRINKKVGEFETSLLQVGRLSKQKTRKDKVDLNRTRD